MNHSKMNVQVRNCTTCGVVVNKTIEKKYCQSEQHNRQRKERNYFCMDCGISLK